MPQFGEAELERIIDIAVRIDDFMYDYDYYSYEDEVTISREENVNLIADSLKEGDVSLYLENLYGIRETIFSDYTDKLNYAQLGDDRRETAEILDAIIKDIELWEADHERLQRDERVSAPDDAAVDLVIRDEITREVLKEELKIREYNRNAAETKMDLVQENEKLRNYSDRVLQRAIEIHDELMEDNARNINRHDRITRAMKIMGFREDLEHSSIACPVYVQEGLPFPYAFQGLMDAEKWIDGIIPVLNDGSLAEQVDQIMHPVHFEEVWAPGLISGKEPGHIVPVKEFRDSKDGHAYEGSMIAQWNAYHNLGVDRNSGETFEADRSFVYNAVSDFIKDNPDSPISRYHPADLEPENVYELYDAALALSHREEMKKYDGRIKDSIKNFSNRGYGELLLVAELYYAKEAGLDDAKLELLIELEKERSGGMHDFNPELFRLDRNMVQRGVSGEDLGKINGKSYYTKLEIADGLPICRNETQKNLLFLSHSMESANYMRTLIGKDIKDDSMDYTPYAQAILDMDAVFTERNRLMQEKLTKTDVPEEKNAISAQMVSQEGTDGGFAITHILTEMIAGSDAGKMEGGITIPSPEEIRKIGEKILLDSTKMNYDGMTAFLEESRMEKTALQSEKKQLLANEDVSNAEKSGKKDMPLGRAKSSNKESVNEERINELRNMIREGVEAVRNEDSFKAWLNTRAHNFTNKYSFNNIILVALQKPDASTVMGYEKWKEFGRQVAKGSTGISIFAPVFYTEKQNGNLCRDIMANLTSQLDADPAKPARYILPGSPITFSMSFGSTEITISLNGNSYKLRNRQQLNEFLQKNVLGKTPKSYSVQTVFDVTDTVTPNFLQLKYGAKPEEIVRGAGEGTAIKNEDGKILAKARFSKEPNAPRGYDWIAEGEIGKGTWELVTAKKGEAVITNPKRKPHEKPEYLIYNTEERKARFNQNLSLSVVEKEPEIMYKLFESLTALSESKGVPVFVVERTDSLWKGGDANGYFMRTEGLEKAQYPKGYIVIPKELLENEPTRACKTLIHEEAHADLHGTAGRLDKEIGERVTRAMKETQAESVAYMVCRNFGIDTSDYSFKYLAAWTHDAQMKDFEKSLKVIDSEAKQLVDEINAQLEIRGLSRALTELPKEPLSQETLTEEAKKYSRRAIEARAQIDSISNIIPRQMESVKDNPSKSKIILRQKKNLEEQHLEVDRQLELALSLENTTDSREAQDAKILEIEASFERSANLRLAFEDMSESLKTIDSRSKTGLIMQYEHNPLATLNKMARTHEELKVLSTMQMQYIAKSSYIKDKFSHLLATDPASFAREASKRAEEVVKVVSKSGVFVEVVSCQSLTNPPVFIGGEICHPKVADKIISEAEVQIRHIKENSDFFPSVESKVAVYSMTEKHNVSCYIAEMKLGDATQSSLSDFIHKAAAGKKSLIEAFDSSIKERGAKNKIFIPTGSHGEKGETSVVSKPEGITLEGAKAEISERKYAVQNNMENERNKRQEKETIHTVMEKGVI